MLTSRRPAFGATVIACALWLIASPVFGGAVCGLDHDAAQTIVASDDARPSEWIVSILGERYISARGKSVPVQDVSIPELRVVHETSDAFNTPRAAVIPLPAPLWSGLAGLAALVTASAARKFRRLL